MSYLTQHLQPGDGVELHAPDATLTAKVDAEHTDGTYELFEVDAVRDDPTPLHRTGWAKTYYVLQGRILVQVDDEGFDLGPGSSIAIPPNAPHTFTVLTPSAKFLVFSMGSGMGRFHADMSSTVPQGHPMEEVLEQIQQVLSRHDVTVEGMGTPSEAPSGASRLGASQ
ncbi:cupin domain-containing protein [Arthrobacter sp. JZ12]|uniref:cupin domain-containing protein n=1 Tax=Arthrobacter sp. JZ12 TaxID=2654190 RepID=UPI002B45C94B|nr:cupin domain-containing protein [Arthrobacter sp. JZ12]WRH24485.1 cupin domain-containing protein [Arthrobacter sp. JZ12]